jgi:putative Ig domain-containing protein
VRLRTHRKRTTRFTAAGTAVAAFLATLAGLLGASIGTSIAPAGAETNGPTTYEVDCSSPPASLAGGATAPFVMGLNVNTSPTGPQPAGTPFSVSGTATETLIGPVIAGAYQAINLALTGGLNASVSSETVGTTDGTATGSFTYSHNFGTLPAPGAQRTNVSWVAGSTTLTAPVGTFMASDVGTPTNPMFVAGPGASAGDGIDPNSTVVSVAADGSSITISTATLAAQTGVNVGLGQSLTFADPAFSTGTVFTSSGAARSNVGVTSMASSTLSTAGGGITLTFGGSPGFGTANCLLTGYDAAGTPGPSQSGDTTPADPAIMHPQYVAAGITPLVLATGGFITQPGTTQAITPPAAAFVPGQPVENPPVTTNATATIDRNVSNTTTVTLPATDTDATPVTSCSLVGSPSDPRLMVSIGAPTASGCPATLTDTDGASTGATVTFQFNATDGVGTSNTSTVTVTIVPIPHVAIATTSLPNADEGVAYSATLTGTGGTPPYTWLASGLPTGLSVDPSTGVISGTPAAGTGGAPCTTGTT